MKSYIEKIKEVSERLLKEGKVDSVIGFRKGTVPLMNEPYIAKTPQDVHNLVWDSNCGINLANYLTDRKEKIGIIVKGCNFERSTFARNRWGTVFRRRRM